MDVQYCTGPFVRLSQYSNFPTFYFKKKESRHRENSGLFLMSIYMSIFYSYLLTEYKHRDFRGLPPAGQTMDLGVIDCDVLDKIKVPHATCLVCYYVI